MGAYFNFILYSCDFAAEINSQTFEKLLNVNFVNKFSQIFLYGIPWSEPFSLCKFLQVRVIEEKNNLIINKSFAEKFNI